MMLASVANSFPNAPAPRGAAFAGKPGRLSQNSTPSYYRARYYDPAAGRFGSEDPAYILGGINAYAYVENDPADFRDPFGLQKCNCEVPLHPDGVDPSKNIQDAEENGYPWWFNHVKKWNGPWDYKNYNGQPHPEYDDFGNFNYGATGAAMGVPLNLLLRGAGAAKWRRYPGNDPFGRPWDRSGNFGNQPEKNQQIINGYNWYKNCGPHYQATGPLKLPPGWPASL
jgi:RHS repeat-associated protein